MADEPASDASPLRRRRKATAVRPSARTTTETLTVPPSAQPDPDPPAGPAAAPVDDDLGAVSHRSARSRPDTRFWIGLAAAAIAIGVLVGGVAAYAVHAGKKTFQSQAVLEIDQARAVAASPDDGVVAKLSRLRYVYAGLVRTESFYGPLARSANLDEGLVASSVYAITDPSSLLLVVGARGSNADQTMTIAAAAADHLVKFARDQQDTEGIPTQEQVTFAVVTPAGDPTKISPKDSRSALVGIGAFLFVALGTMGFGYLWRRDS
jgi:hypothetical protein